MGHCQFKARDSQPFNPHAVCGGCQGEVGDLGDGEGKLPSGHALL